MTNVHALQQFAHLARHIMILLALVILLCAAPLALLAILYLVDVKLLIAHHALDYLLRVAIAHQYVVVAVWNVIQLLIIGVNLKFVPRVKFVVAVHAYIPLVRLVSQEIQEENVQIVVRVTKLAQMVVVLHHLARLVLLEIQEVCVLIVVKAVKIA